VRKRTHEQQARSTLQKHNSGDADSSSPV
jgi:hypothetical protein